METNMAQSVSAVHTIAATGIGTLPPHQKTHKSAIAEFNLTSFSRLQACLLALVTSAVMWGAIGTILVR